MTNSTPSGTSSAPDSSAALSGLLFRDARTFNGWLPQPVTEATLREIYDLAGRAPTAANSNPGRVAFVTSPEAKERLRPALASGNVEKTMAAPATAIVAFDPNFHEQMSTLFPARPELGRGLAAMPEPGRGAFLLQNSSLLAGYLIVAARSLGLDCGPMGGFEKDKLDAEFFAESGWRSVLLINIGHGDPHSLHPKNPRLTFEQACRIL
jgi:3-hydroxypropanoate dehydrogenase